MQDFTPYLGFIAVSLMIALSPGPSWAYTISTTLGHGRKAGMIGNLGNSTGILCHAVAVALGLAALLQYSSTAFHVIKFLGVSYLVYLAIKAFRGDANISTTAETNGTDNWKIFRNGAFVSIFNPKISLLMLALLPQFVDPATQNPEMHIAAMGAMHALTAAIVHTHLILFSGGISSRLKKSGKVQKAMRWATGTVFLGFGARLALSDNH
jgi:threonine/homoserine/homoserine lactone efflux protein